jgi:hypothetical protein
VRVPPILLHSAGQQMLALGQIRSYGFDRSMSGLARRADLRISLSKVAKVPEIGIGGSLAAPPLPHHRTYGSVYGGSGSYANARRSRTGTQAI